MVATTGERVPGTGYDWHVFPDGGACFPTDDGWIYASNSEVGDDGGGAGAVRFDGDGEVVDAYRILRETSTNCAGGPTPWGTWLSCEEVGEGQVWECDPTQEGQGEVRPALGRFEHEAVAVDPDEERLYLTEDDSTGRLYRFTPERYPSLDAGLLEVADVTADGAVTWAEVPDPDATERPIREQGVGTVFDGGEGIWYHDGEVYVATKGDNVVWSYDTRAERIETVYSLAETPSGPLRGVDNLATAANGDLYVCEDGDDMQLMLITPDGTVAPFLQVLEQAGSELAGVAFSPDGGRLLLSSQRGGAAGTGITYLVEGPFRQPEAATPVAPATTLRAAAGTGSGSDDDFPWAVTLGVGAAVVAAAGAGAVVLRRRHPAAAPGGGKDDAAR